MPLRRRLNPRAFHVYIFSSILLSWLPGTFIRFLGFWFFFFWVVSEFSNTIDACESMLIASVTGYTNLDAKFI